MKCRECAYFKRDKRYSFGYCSKENMKRQEDDHECYYSNMISYYCPICDKSGALYSTNNIFKHCPVCGHHIVTKTFQTQNL